MASENVEALRRLIDAFNRHDVRGVVDCCDPAIELHSTFARIGGADYQGHAGVRRWYGDLEREWHDPSSELEAIYELGENVLAMTVFRGRGTQSGAEAELPGAVITRASGGRLVYFKAIAHREDALAELGVSEDALGPRM